MPFDVFISYSMKDKATAEAVCARLEAASLRCWIAARDITPGADWAESIIAAMESCRAMVLIFSSHANASPQVRREVQRAFEKGLTVMPFRIEDVTPNSSLEYYIGSVHWLDAITKPMELHIDKLVVLIKAFIAAAIQTEQTDKGSVTAPETGGLSPAAHFSEAETISKQEQRNEVESQDSPRQSERGLKYDAEIGVTKKATIKSKKAGLIFAVGLLIAGSGVANWWFGIKKPKPEPRQPNPATAVANQLRQEVPAATPRVNEHSLPAMTRVDYSGNVGKLPAIYELEWHDDGTVSGDYYYPSCTPRIVYGLRGKNLANGLLELDEYTDKLITAHISLMKRLESDRIIWEGQMHNTDGRKFSMTITRDR